MSERTFWKIVGLFMICLVLLVWSFEKSKAQPLLGDGSSFSISCALSDRDHVTVLVHSNREEQFTLAMDGGPAPTTIPLTFTTEPGDHVLGTIDNSQHFVRAVYFITSEGPAGVMDLQDDYMRFCDPMVLPEATPAPEATEQPIYVPPTCEATAIDSATGHAYCYVKRQDGVVPLPPPFS